MICKLLYHFLKLLGRSAFGGFTRNEASQAFHRSWDGYSGKQRGGAPNTWSFTTQNWARADGPGSCLLRNGYLPRLTAILRISRHLSYHPIMLTSSNDLELNRSWNACNHKRTIPRMRKLIIFCRLCWGAGGNAIRALHHEDSPPSGDPMQSIMLVRSSLHHSSPQPRPADELPRIIYFPELLSLNVRRPTLPSLASLRPRSRIGIRNLGESEFRMTVVSIQQEQEYFPHAHYPSERVPHDAVRQTAEVGRIYQV